MIIAFVMQLAIIPGMDLKFERAQVLYLVLDYRDQGIIPVHGILNSRNAYNPPFFVWLYILPVMLLRDISLVLSLPAILLSILAILVFYLFGRRYFNAKMGLIAGALFVISPLGLHLGHSSWAQAVNSHFYVLLIFFLGMWLLERKTRYLALVLPISAWIAGVHWGGLLAIGIIIPLAFLFRAKYSLVPILIGIIFSVLLWAPYLIFEQGRDFADVLAIIQDPLPAPMPEEVTPFCSHENSDQSQTPEVFPVDSSLDERTLGKYKEILSEQWPEIYDVLVRIKDFLVQIVQKARDFVMGIGLALHTNFRRNPFQGATATRLEQILHFLYTAIFIFGIGVLLFRIGFRRNACRAEYFLLSIFFVPILLQNILPFSTLFRPDITWLFYGSQVLIIAYALAVPKWVNLWVTRILIGVLICLTFILYTSEMLKPLGVTLFGRELSPQARMTSWIAEDMTREGRKEASIRYDYLQEIPEHCWIVSVGTLDDRYYYGTENDYILLSQYGINNTSKALDGWAEDPDYIVVLPEGLFRYYSNLDEFKVMDLDGYLVLKPLQ